MRVGRKPNIGSAIARRGEDGIGMSICDRRKPSVALAFDSCLFSLPVLTPTFLGPCTHGRAEAAMMLEE